MWCDMNIFNTELFFSHGASSVTVSRLVPHIVKLLSDPTALVRDCAFNTLVECYKHYGERLRADLAKKHNVPPSKWVLPRSTLWHWLRIHIFAYLWNICASKTIERLTIKDIAIDFNYFIKENFILIWIWIIIEIFL